LSPFAHRPIGAREKSPAQKAPSDSTIDFRIFPNFQKLYIFLLTCQENCETAFLASLTSGAFRPIFETDIVVDCPVLG
jgi:hypothetical protein